MFNKLPNNEFFLAPLAGINDPVFRLMCEREGAGLTFTELVSIDFIHSEKERSLKDLQRHKFERCVGLQLFGKHPSKVSDAMHFAQDKFDFFDLNAGCPASNIMGQGAGADLMGKPTLLLHMLKKIIDNTNKPVTLKYRLGLNRHKENFLDIAKKAEDLGVDMITLHARFANQRYSGKAKWDRIKKLKESMNIPVTGNGDVSSPELAKDLLDKTGCDYGMVGRWSRGNPWCFRQINDFLKFGKYSSVDSKTKIKGFLNNEEEANKFNISFARKKIHAMQFTKGIVGSVNLRRTIAEAKSEEQIIKSMLSFLEK